ncbi:hypothetical protein IMSAGC011_01426 [Lachnospiraceae bacterium]|nr:hypothetical protein IMSAGC011_01426 [Lachnospiraceae bacterium]
MKRLCIYVTYDFENIVDDYIGHILYELRKVTDCLIVVCNYSYIAQGIENIQPYADKIYYRENKGFDAGAYKEVLCQRLGWDWVCSFDELLLVNDSFYGFFYPIEDLFQIIENTDADYWGITRAPQGIFSDGYRYDTHIQSYFLTFRTKILNSNCFKEFWETLEYPKTLYDAVLKFEIGCNKYFKQHGFKETSLTDQFCPNCLFDNNQIPYMNYSLELIRDLKIPILKRRSLYFSNKGFENALSALKYINDANFFDTTLVTKHLFRISQIKLAQGMIDLIKLNSFYHKHSKIYFYGAGVYGQNLAKYFCYKGWTFAGYVVTKDEKSIENCKAFSEVELNSDDGIIIAVSNKEICLEILEIVQKCCSDNQILYPNY